MSINHNDGDLLRNPAVDYDRSDLSPRGILLFLAGLLVAGIFIELVIWGMFRFLSHSPLFAQGNPSPLVQVQTVGQEKAPGAKMQNTGQVDTQVFPQPRLQTNDVVDMNDFLQRERDILYPEQPFEDSAGTVHIPINQAMSLIVERGLPVRPSAPPRDFSTQTESGNPKYTQTEGQTSGMPATGTSHGAKPGPEQKQ
jgi:hypothetical protein